MPVPTDHLADEIHDLRKEFADFRVDIAKNLGAINLDLTEKLSAINASLEGFKGRTDTKLKVAQWVAGAGLTIAILVTGWAFGDVQRTARLEESVIALRDAIKAQADSKGLLLPKDGPSVNHPIGQLPPGAPKKSDKP